MKIEILDDWNKVSLLEREWNRLLACSKANTLFLTWEWISAWREAGGETNTPFVICARDSSGKLVGIAPFYVSLLRLSGVVPYRTLRFLADTRTGAEYPDLIVHPTAEQYVTHCLVDALVRSGEEWDCLWMPSVAGWTGAVDRVLQPFQEYGLFSLVRPCEFSCVELPDTMDAYFGSLSTSRQEHFRGDIRRFSKRQHVTIKRCETLDQVPAVLDALFELHYQRWRSRGEEGSFRRKPQLVTFYNQFIPRALANGWLRLFAVQDQGDYGAVQLGYEYDNTFYAIQEGFDPRLKGVGNFLRAHIIEECISAGVKSYDFLGEVTEHKRRWGARMRLGYDVLIGSDKLKNRPLFSAGVWPTGRWLRPAA